ncbi:NADH-quinone oxidoreductase subunit J [Helicobacter hepaticus]|jgi:NADH-quinone oxidoreductase subunit J|uniref:NADH-quinone oxidoreductase subunit J n=1 Tax=Helicobacter hepaticus (strain ATCC 51449 / 3B1) TaxID=235279 RepID=Q7VFT1_HELHP|nr:NADH-quinone oxidoreductase subunit J [Helicobacter hepaticus]AAP78191.1 donor-ubiquinone reductase I [Helicobacter hepaticus ATCC 51449]
MFETIAFYLFSTLCIVSFLIVVTSKRILYAMTALASGMIFISGIFFVLDAEFLGVVQIIVYSGSVVALYAFAMMFFDTSKDIIESYKNEWVVCILCFGIAVVLVCIFGMPLLGSNLEAVADSQNLLNIAEMNNIQMIGYIIFTKYLIPFEIAAFMLLVAMVVGIILSIKRSEQ